MQALAPQKSREELILAKIESSYKLIDRASKAYSEAGNSVEKVPADMEEMLAFFADPAVYDRAGQILEGSDAIREFYTSAGPQGRVGLEGEHSTKDQVMADSSTVFVRGEFTKANGEVIPFMDVWEFEETANEDEPLVRFRETYLKKGSDEILGMDLLSPEGVMLAAKFSNEQVSTLTQAFLDRLKRQIRTSRRPPLVILRPIDFVIDTPGLNLEMGESRQILKVVIDMFRSKGWKVRSGRTYSRSDRGRDTSEPCLFFDREEVQ